MNFNIEYAVILLFYDFFYRYKGNKYSLIVGNYNYTACNNVSYEIDKPEFFSWLRIIELCNLDKQQI